MKYLIVYDLRNRGRSTVDHKKMDELLEEVWEAQRVLGSKWVTETEDSPQDILQHIKDQDFFKPSDGILVCALIEFGKAGFSGVSGSYCSFGLLPTDFDFL